MMEITLNTLAQGENATVVAVRLAEALRRRLLDFGLMEGTKITCLRRSSADGPSVYLLRGTMLALRKSDAAGIGVERCE